MHIYQPLVSFHGDVIRQSFWFEKKRRENAGKLIIPGKSVIKELLGFTCMKFVLMTTKITLCTFYG